MYQISEHQWAIEEGDNISFVKDGGGQLQVSVEDYTWDRVVVLKVQQSQRKVRHAVEREELLHSLRNRVLAQKSGATEG